MKQGRDLHFLVCLYPHQIQFFLTLSKKHLWKRVQKAQKEGMKTHQNYFSLTTRQHDSYHCCEVPKLFSNRNNEADTMFCKNRT